MKLVTGLLAAVLLLAGVGVSHAVVRIADDRGGRIGTYVDKYQGLRTSGETVIIGIGQGYWVVTPIQLASALATLADGSVRRPPRLLLATQDGVNTARTPAAGLQPVAGFVRNPDHLAAIRAGMVAVMHGPTGTARATGAGAAFTIAGKSGTAQRVRRREGEEYDERRVAQNLRHQALFVACAPAEAPRIAVAVVVEHGSSGSKAAAPVARRILDSWLQREQAP